jgi:hypothetical protein
MFINYKETNVHALPHVSSKTVKVRNKRTGKVRLEARMEGQSPQDIHWLRPGWNEFPKHVWEQNKDHPSIKKMLKENKIVLLAEPVTVTQGSKKVKKIIGMDDEEVSLKLFTDVRAIEIVKETLNRDILQRWLDEETRHKVKRALKKQIEPLLNNEKEDEED